VHLLLKRSSLRSNRNSLPWSRGAHYSITMAWMNKLFLTKLQFFSVSIYYPHNIVGAVGMVFEGTQHYNIVFFFSISRESSHQTTVDLIFLVMLEIKNYIENLVCVSSSILIDHCMVQFFGKVNKTFAVV